MGIDVPVNIVRFERLAYLSLAITAASSALNWPTIRNGFSQMPAIYSLALISAFAMPVLFIWLIVRRRQNWARWTWLLIVVVGFVSALFDMTTRFNNGIAAAIAYYLAYGIWIPAVYFLFAPGSGSWFRRIHL